MHFLMGQPESGKMGRLGGSPTRVNHQYGADLGGSGPAGQASPHGLIIMGHFSAQYPALTTWAITTMGHSPAQSSAPNTQSPNPLQPHVAQLTRVQPTLACTASNFHMEERKNFFAKSLAFEEKCSMLFAVRNPPCGFPRCAVPLTPR
jgi:hypothetical protein